jgi:uncharacterized protein YdhG (YjbR/CyaY superfamily)
MSPRPAFASTEEYFASVAPDARRILEEIRSIIERTVPDAQATLSYQMPAFKTDRPFIYLAAFKNHIGIFPPVQGDERLMEDLLPYRGPKGNLKFPLGRPMPYDLIEQVVHALHQQYSKRKR